VEVARAGEDVRREGVGGGEGDGGEVGEDEVAALGGCVLWWGRGALVGWGRRWGGGNWRKEKLGSGQL
jgi:hypothetical protein